MGKVSTKENKNIYQIKREENKLSREQASEVINIAPDRIERIENRGAVPYPDEVISMAKGYKDPSLCNYYCSKECEIGRQYVPEVSIKNLSQIVIEMVVSLNSMQNKKDRLMEIAVDNIVDSDQIEDFVEIQEELEKISILVETLQFWSEDMLAKGHIDREAYEALRNKRKKE